MNCEEFNGRLYDYLDEALPAELLNAAQAHLAQCAPCRHALRREQALAESLRAGFTRAAAHLKVSARMQQQLLNACKPRPRPVEFWRRAWLQLVAYPRWPALAGVGLVVAGVLAWLIVQSRPPAGKHHESVALNMAAAGWVVDVPTARQIHQFERVQDRVVDAVVREAARAHATFSQER